MKATSGKAMCRLLESRGWQLKRIRGSHHIYAKLGHSAVLVVPVHANRDRKKGMLKHLLASAGLAEVNLNS